ncbi:MULTISPECIES: YcnI family protein [unclassified Nocardia]|uniref:YcnI family copper-binding membrane protein n=1 Tax=unclassified Nocardia TaxID=2637762 RepID=UPI001CE475DE|nr:MULTISPECIES: YcnI family protein [unclassified Nocardia]
MNLSLSRALCAPVAAAGLVLLGAGTAAAHVTVDAPGAKQGGYAVATFKVPDESDTASTTSLNVAIPNMKSARPEPIPGWSVKVDKNDKSEITGITWTADAGSTGIAPGQFQRFVVSLGPLPKQDKLSFPAKQTYSDGKVVAWDQPMGPNGSEPEHPVPSLTLTSTPVLSDDSLSATKVTTSADHDSTDTTARWLGGIGLALGLLGFALGLGSVIRNRRS